MRLVENESKSGRGMEGLYLRCHLTGPDVDKAEVTCSQAKPDRRSSSLLADAGAGAACDSAADANNAEPKRRTPNPG